MQVMLMIDFVLTNVDNYLPMSIAQLRRNFDDILTQDYCHDNLR